MQATAPYAPSLSIRPIEPEDLNLLYTIENDPELWHCSTSDALYSRFALRQYLSSLRPVAEMQELRMVVETTADAIVTPVGLAELTNIDLANARAEVGIALLRKHRGHGFGTRALLLLERIARERLHLHQLYALVSVHNAVAINAFTHGGYGEVATLPQWHRTAEGYQDVKVLQKILEK